MMVLVWVFSLLICELVLEFAHSFHDNYEHNHGHIIPRTAVCVSGQLRSLNLEIRNDEFAKDLWPMITKYRTDSMSDWTVAKSIREYLFPALGNVDVFMNILTREGPHEPKVGDVSVCEPLRPTHPQLRPAHVDCEVIKEVDLSYAPKDLNGKNTMWEKYFYKDVQSHQGLLKQLYSLFRCSVLIQKHMVETGITYDYMVRLRPEMALFSRMDNISSFGLKRNIIKHVHRDNCCCGHEDWFGIGHSSAMLPYLTRFGMLQNWFTPEQFPGDNFWNAEMFALSYLKELYNITLEPDIRIPGCLLKFKSHGYGHNQPGA